MAPAHADGAPNFRVGTLPFGAVQWELKAITDNGFDTAEGIKVESVPVASTEAARTAFLSGSVDAIAQDLFFAARLRAEGKSVQFLPYSSAEGGLMVAASSPIKAIADLDGKSIGIAGGPLDKNWLLLRAAAQEVKLDLTKAAKPVFGAPPLLAAKVENGELDCGLLYWSTCARLSAKGYRRVFETQDLASMLGAKGTIAFGGILIRQDADKTRLAGFAKSVHAAERVLIDKPAAWIAIRPFMQAADDATFAALKTAFLKGIPRKSRAEEISDAQSFFALIAGIGGAALVGDARSLPASLYVDETVYGTSPRAGEGAR